MLTIFGIPKPFLGNIATIQRNAITSWTVLRPEPEIILFGDDTGTAETARELAVRHVPEVLRNQFGTPLLDDVFEKAQQLARDRLLCYVNADIILMEDFSRAVERASAWPRFLMVGRRWDLDLSEACEFHRPDWQERLRARTLRSGKQGPPNAADYFLFSKGLGSNLAPLAVGRRGWDNWLIWRARSTGAAVMDASGVVMAIHQKHDYSHHPGGARGVWLGEEARRNRELIGEWWHLYTIEDATHRMTPERLQPSRRHGWLMFKRCLSHPRSMFRLAANTLARAFVH